MSYIGYQGGVGQVGGSYIGQAPGLGQRTAFRFVAYMGQSKFTGLDATGYPLGYTPGLIDVYVNGRLLSEPDYTASDGSTLTINAGLDLGTEVRVLAQAPWSPANTYTLAQADAQFTRRRNRIVDPGMRISQENGNNLLTTANGGNGVYPSDAWVAYRVGATGGASAQRIALTTPGGSLYRNRITVTAANAAPSAGDSLHLVTRIEGTDVADLRFGTSTPRTIAVRFGCRSSVAGTFGIYVLNRDQNRSWIGSVTIASGEVGQDVVKSAILVGDTTGTWLTDNNAGLAFGVALCAGSSYQGAVGWQAGTFIAPAGATNLMATNGATFDLFDVGLYDVTGLQRGVFPSFELAAYADDLLRCQRYYEQVVAYQIGTNASTTAGYSGSNYKYKSTKRVLPSVVLVSVIQNTNVNQSIYLEGNGNYSDSFTATINYSASNTWAAGGIFAANARL